ncbi:ATP-binding protein [Salinispirillum sp. LH 10-3-1]|uniref:histidine kinase n=1 Tax=Salinispirillum sp. LH 10-3-1 TaxID=2952525 RepID=A0AB38YE13_9GAMM
MPFPSIWTSLRAVLLWQVALPMLALLALILAGALAVISELSEQRLQRDLRQVARAIHLPVSQALERKDFAQLQTSLESVFDISEVYGAYLFDENGGRLVSFGAVNPTQAQADEALQLTERGEFAQYERIRGRNVYSFFLPLFDTSGQPSGLLQVTRLRADIERELTQLKAWSWLGFAAVALLILGTLALTHQRSVGRPLQALLTSMRQVSAGQISHRAKPVGPQEIQELASTLNGMLDAIAKAEQQAAEQRKAGEILTEKLRQTETLAALGQLSGGVAHELGAPLTVVDGRARRLLRHTTAPQDVAELEDIREQTRRMTAIVEQLLSYGRSSRHQHRPIALTDWLEQTLQHNRAAFHATQIQAGPEVSVYGDALSLEQVLSNLLRNAWQAPEVNQVAIRWSVTDGTLQLSVEDNGKGIATDQRERIFEPFFTTKQPGDGTGLGLAIAQRVLREHNGQLRVSDSALGGACFTLTLPVHRTDQGTHHE